MGEGLPGVGGGGGGGGAGEGTSARGRRRGRRALLAHQRIAALRGSPADRLACAGVASPSRPEGGAPRTRPRRAALAPAPDPLPPDSPSLSRKRAWLPTHTQPGEKCFCSRWAVVSQEFDAIISQDGTEKLRVASFLPLCTVQKNRCASPRLQNGSDYRIKELRK